MDTLPDLRVTIAESMTALAWSLPGRSIRTPAEHRRLLDGAETLRWCAQYEAPSYEEMKADRDAALVAQKEAEENVRDLVVNVRAAASSWKHAEACPVDPCVCGLDARRKSVLDAVD